MGTESEAAWTRFLALGRTARDDGELPSAIRPLFAAGGRFRRFSWRGGDLLLDLSKTALTEPVLDAALDLAHAVDLAGQRDAMAGGERVNTTERRAALHLALRAPPGVAMRAGDEDATAAVQDSLARMRTFCDAVHAGAITTADGGRFTDVLNIGIGGSDLGPAMAARALWTPAAPLRPHYLANVDGHAWEEIRGRLDPARTLVLIASKTFTTQETMANAGLARAWLAAAVGEQGVGAHLAALSTNLRATAAFGIAPERVFGFRDWVGGRFSLWSAIGLSVALALGWDAFARLLAGARVMDEHFLAAPLDANLPVLLAFAEIWHVNALGYPTRAVLPYDERLARLPAHLQQVEMESLGKRVTRDGAPVTRATGPVVFGEPGTNAQHSFMQLIHHSPTPVPCDVILVANPDHKHADSHAKLLANGLAQAEALLEGRSLAAVTAQMRAAGADAAEIARLAPHRVFPGDRPSVTILLPRLDPFTLGQLVALYEHKVACLGALWGINPFDQFGVELGKEVCAAILPELEHGPAPDAHDGSTRGLIREIRRAQGDVSGLGRKGESIEGLRAATPAVRRGDGDSPATTWRDPQFLKAGKRPRLDGRAMLEFALRSSEWKSLEGTLAALTIFVHPDAITAVGGKAIFHVVRATAQNPRGTFFVDAFGRNLMADDNTSAHIAFRIVSDFGIWQDVTVNHLYAASSDADHYTNPMNLILTPTFLDKLTNTQAKGKIPGLVQILRYRAFELYGYRGPIPDQFAPTKPSTYPSAWADPVGAGLKQADVVKRAEAILKKSPKARHSQSVLKLGWAFYRPES